jgi:hypothetical protein
MTFFGCRTARGKMLPIGRRSVVISVMEFPLCHSQEAWSCMLSLETETGFFFQRVLVSLPDKKRAEEEGLRGDA